MGELLRIEFHQGAVDQPPAGFLLLLAFAGRHRQKPFTRYAASDRATNR